MKFKVIGKLKSIIIRGKGNAVNNARVFKLGGKGKLKKFTKKGKKKSKRWKVGDPVNKRIGKKYPPWETVRKRFWKNEAAKNSGKYSKKNLDRMKKGKAPLHNPLGVPKEIHHEKGRKGPDPHNPKNLKPVWPWEHDAIDPFRHYTGPRP